MRKTKATSAFCLLELLTASVKSWPIVRPKKAGLKENDKLLTADGKPIESWQAWTELFRASPGKRIELTYERDGKILATAIRPDSVEQLGRRAGG